MGKRGQEAGHLQIGKAQFLLTALHFHRDDVAFVFPSQKVHHLGLAIDAHAVDLADYVAGLDARNGGG